VAALTPTLSRCAGEGDRSRGREISRPWPRPFPLRGRGRPLTRESEISRPSPRPSPAARERETA